MPRKFGRADAERPATTGTRFGQSELTMPRLLSTLIARVGIFDPHYVIGKGLSTSCPTPYDLARETLEALLKSIDRTSPKLPLAESSNHFDTADKVSGNPKSGESPRLSFPFSPATAKSIRQHGF